MRRRQSTVFIAIFLKVLQIMDRGLLAKSMLKRFKESLDDAS
jgi:hypothetical protein